MKAIKALYFKICTT